MCLWATGLLSGLHLWLYMTTHPDVIDVSLTTYKPPSNGSPRLQTGHTHTLSLWCGSRDQSLPALALHPTPPSLPPSFNQMFTAPVFFPSYASMQPMPHPSFFSFLNFLLQGSVFSTQHIINIPPIDCKDREITFKKQLFVFSLMASAFTSTDDITVCQLCVIHTETDKYLSFAWWAFNELPFSSKNGWISLADPVCSWF